MIAGHVREIADKSLDWNELGPIVAEQRKLIEEPIKRDTRKLGTTEAFLSATAPEATPAAKPEDKEKGSAREPSRRETSLRDFADKRRDYLLNYKEKAKDEPKKPADK